MCGETVVLAHTLCSSLTYADKMFGSLPAGMSVADVVVVHLPPQDVITTMEYLERPTGVPVMGRMDLSVYFMGSTNEDAVVPQQSNPVHLVQVVCYVVQGPSRTQAHTKKTAKYRSSAINEIGERRTQASSPPILFEEHNNIQLRYTLYAPHFMLC